MDVGVEGKTKKSIVMFLGKADLQDLSVLPTGVHSRAIVPRVVVVPDDTSTWLCWWVFLLIATLV